MRLICNLRAARGDRTLADMAKASGVLASELSRIERGQLLPADHQLDGLERAYGLQRSKMWHESVLWAAVPDEAAAA